jgi:urease alpha subunit
VLHAKCLFFVAAFGLALITSSFYASGRETRAQSYDLVIKNARIVDGSGNPWFRSEVGIKNELIKRIGRIEIIANDQISSTRPGVNLLDQG